MPIRNPRQASSLKTWLNDESIMRLSFTAITLSIAQLHCGGNKSVSTAGESLELSSSGTTTVSSTDSSDSTGSDNPTEGPCEDEQWTPDPQDEVLSSMCEALMDETACTTTNVEGVECEWLSSRVFPMCQVSSCESSILENICVAVRAAPQTGCGAPCDGFWRRNAAGLHLIQEAYCFKLPVGWRSCATNPRPECACPCFSESLP